MRKILEALRLRADGLSGRQIALSLSLGRATVSDYLRRADVAALSWSLPANLRYKDLIAGGPQSPRPGAPHTFVTTEVFIATFNSNSLRDVPDLIVDKPQSVIDS